MSPDQFGLDGFEECLDGSIIVAICFSVHRCFEPMLTQDRLIVMRTKLAATIRVMDADLWRRTERDGRLPRTDRQVTFHAIADRSADHAP